VKFTIPTLKLGLKLHLLTNLDITTHLIYYLMEMLLQ
jgi:hypothetical protein